MSFAVILENVESRIRSRVLDIKHVADIVELSNLIDGTRSWSTTSHQMPAVYIFPESNSASPNYNIAQHSQSITANIGILIMISALNVRRDSGQFSTQKLDTISSDLISALIGFNPLHGVTPSSSLNYVSGKLQDFQNGLILWKQTYSMSYIISS